MAKIHNDPNDALSETEVRQFVHDGFVRLDRAFSRQLADQCRARLWHDTGCDPDDPKTWTRPVIRLDYLDEKPFKQAVNTPRLHAAFDQLVGNGRWIPRPNLGTFPVRFPSPDDPGDAGWHVDASFAGDDAKPDDYATWRVNVTSRGRALLLLFLFSDVAMADAPTRIRVRSHLAMARRLEPAGEVGIMQRALDLSGEWPLAYATGEAGAVYLCHPFLIHAAQRHLGCRPRFMAQPPLHPAQPFRLFRADGSYSPVEQAIRLGLATGPESRCMPSVSHRRVSGKYPID